MAFGLDPWTEMRRMQRTFERIFDYDPLMPSPAGYFLPASLAAPPPPPSSPAPSTTAAETAVSATPAAERALWWNPRTDLCETENSFEVHLELPGIHRDEITVDFSNNVLTVRGTKKHAAERQGEKWHSVERRFGQFARSFTLPQGTEVNKIDATFENGLLVVRIPKQALPQQAEPKKIDIK